jgi:hypothetical protein
MSGPTKPPSKLSSKLLASKVRRPVAWRHRSLRLQRTTPIGTRCEPLPFHGSFHQAKPVMVIRKPYDNHGPAPPECAAHFAKCADGTVQ